MRLGRGICSYDCAQVLASDLMGGDLHDIELVPYLDNEDGDSS